MQIWFHYKINNIFGGHRNEKHKTGYVHTAFSVGSKEKVDFVWGIFLCDAPVTVDVL